MRVFIAGSHTDAGKTSVSAALCYAFGLEYFKLIQAGMPTDSQTLSKLSPQTKIHPNGITLKHPTSPHIAKILEQVCYEGLTIPLPASSHLLVESAGGLFTPLDSHLCMIDYLAASKLPCILVGKYYLGAINHILLSIMALKQQKIQLLGLIISGEQNLQNDEFIAQYSQIPIAHFSTFNTQEEFQDNALKLKKQIEKWGFD